MAGFTTQRLPRCCGVLEVGGFIQTALLAADLKAFVKRGPDDVGGKVGMLIATTNSEQRVAAQALQDAGFTEMAEFHNPKSGNKVKLWGIEVNQPKPKPPPMPKNVVAKLVAKPKRKPAAKRTK